jgi:hypothetical protein
MRSSRRIRRWPPGVRKAESLPAFTQLMIDSGETWQSFAASKVVKTVFELIRGVQFQFLDVKLLELMATNIVRAVRIVKIEIR